MKNNIQDILKIMNSPVEIKVSIIKNNIYHLNFKNREDLTSTLLRFQEYYESPKFQNQIFTMEEYANWYSNGSENFTYFEDWSGFNFPSLALEPFINGSFNDLTNRENKILDIVKDKKNFYIIATFGEADDEEQIETLKHELAHALFFLNPRYKLLIQTVLKDVDLSTINNRLEMLGYHPSVWLDECHAYILTDLKYLKEQGFNVKPFIPYQKKISVIFNKYIK